MQAYLALSIHSSDTFIRAWYDNVDIGDSDKDAEVEINNRKFIVRRLTGNAVKLHAPELEKPDTESTSGVGTQSIDDPVFIYDYFQKLKAEGWEVDDVAFVKKHNLQKTEAEPEQASEVVNAAPQDAAPTNEKAEAAPETEENKDETE